MQHTGGVFYLHFIVGLLWCCGKKAKNEIKSNFMFVRMLPELPDYLMIFPLGLSCSLLFWWRALLDSPGRIVSRRIPGQGRW